MSRTELNMYNLHKKTIFWNRYQNTKTIIKYMLKNKKQTEFDKRCVQFKSWSLRKNKFISNQTNVCKKSGSFKRTFNRIGWNRHTMRQSLNVGQMPNLKKLSW